MEEQNTSQETMERCRRLVREMGEEAGHPLKAIAVTFGCQMNARDSEKLRGILREVGYGEAESEEEADFVIYNTCTVRENANLHVYGRLGKLVSEKRKKPHLVVALCGCMMQEEQVVEKIRRSFPVVDLIFGTHNLFRFPELLLMALSGRKRVIEIWEGTCPSSGSIRSNPA